MMRFNKYAGLAFAGLLLFVGGAPIAGQERGSTQAKELRMVSVTYSSPTSGAEMYKNYCAVCHGTRGQGDGPAVRFLKTPPPDLRKLSLSNHGVYPIGRVQMELRAGNGSRVHETLDMPLWVPVFQKLDQNQSLAELRIRNLATFIETLQQK